MYEWPNQRDIDGRPVVWELGAPRYSGVDTCEACGREANRYDYDLNSYVCADHVIQPGFTTENVVGKWTGAKP